MTAHSGAMPLVSVVMSCYNAERWVSEAIDSVLGQSMPDFELIVLDDGSTDNTGRILEERAARDGRIIVVRKPNTGLGDSLNQGIARARGEWIARLDADDVCERERLARQLEAARRDGAVVFVGSGLKLIDEHGRVFATHRYPTSHRRLVAHLRHVMKFPPHSSALVRTEALRRAGGYRTRIRRAQDWDLWLRLSALGRLTCVDAPLVRIRKHSSQVSHEEGGRRQLTDCRLGLVSDCIRRLGGADPVDASEEVYITFRTWLEARLVAVGLYRLEDLGQRAAATGSVLRAGAALLRQPLDGIRLLWARWTGERLALRLAREWLYDHSTTKPNWSDQGRRTDQ